MNSNQIVQKVGGALKFFATALLLLHSMLTILYFLLRIDSFEIEKEEFILH